MFLKLLNTNLNTQDKDLGGKPTQIVGNERRQIATVSILPTKTTPQDVISASKKLGQAEAQGQLLAKLSRNQLAAANAWAGIFSTRVNHALGMMKVKERVQRDASKLHKGVLNHNLNLGETQANLSGYDAEFQRAEGIVRF